MPEPAFDPYRPPGSAIGEAAGVAPEPPSASPWLTIWIRPRATLRRILDAGPSPSVLPLAINCGVAIMLVRAAGSSQGDQASGLPLLSGIVLGGGLAGVFLLYLLGFVFRITGRWLGGRGSQRDVRTALAWASVPWVLVVVAYVLVFAFFGEGIFHALGRRELIRREAWVFLVLVFLQLFAMSWSAFLWVQCVAEAHRFSWVRAIGSVVLAYLVYVGVFLVGVGIAYLFGLMPSK